jgi:hypothetical protein
VPPALATFLNLGKASIPLAGKTTLTQLFVRVTEITETLDHKSLLAYSHSRILSHLERGHATNSALCLTLEADSARICSHCAAFREDCNHEEGRLLTWNKLILDTEIEPQPEKMCFTIDLRTQLRGFLCLPFRLWFPFSHLFSGNQSRSASHLRKPCSIQQKVPQKSAACLSFSACTAE